jgi:hypothetical protein
MINTYKVLFRDRLPNGRAQQPINLYISYSIDDYAHNYKNITKEQYERVRERIAQEGFQIWFIPS